MKRRLIGLVSALAVTVGGSLAAAAPAHAATPAVMITKVYYDSPGKDTGANSSLNAEYVQLTNKRRTAVNLKGWTLRDKANHTYKFATDLRLPAGKSVVVHTGKGRNTSAHRYWGRSWYVWNNTGDKAFLRNASGGLVDSCTWTKKGNGYTSC
ncbi:lamin tail domain-containing protein [Micromonospora sp. PLK6-60]|uniref:lamin tail domain-containing protein n=1 Tax=Micromonospora sp. PLK6-60 TaxID=2873383 RepID=UPI001CA6B3FC|nr:lamin tail domain-containing protein [Micromonospora sp. PLK6-60]MBY8871686.1 lamin tail domain-containing protein [Micromonospora sp. PLK6-60]